MNKGTLVLLPGIVRGMGQVAEIEILTRRVQDHNVSGNLPLFKYVDCTVVGGRTDLPDGDYIASFAGFSAVITRHRGLWLSPAIAVADGEQATDQTPHQDQPSYAAAETEVEQPAPPQVSLDAPQADSKADPPALKISPQDNGGSSPLV